MRNRIDIDYSHSRAIFEEVGERLRASLEIDRELRTRSELHPFEAETIDEYVQKINEGEKLLASSEGR